MWCEGNTETPPDLVRHVVSSPFCNSLTCVCLSNNQKFVSTTLRPTPTTYPQLFTWEGCASFVADFLTLDLLEPPAELVSKVTPKFQPAISSLNTNTYTCTSLNPQSPCHLLNENEGVFICPSPGSCSPPPQCCRIGEPHVLKLPPCCAACCSAPTTTPTVSAATQSKRCVCLTRVCRTAPCWTQRLT